MVWKCCVSTVGHWLPYGVLGGNEDVSSKHLFAWLDPGLVSWLPPEPTLPLPFPSAFCPLLPTESSLLLPVSAAGTPAVLLQPFPSGAFALLLAAFPTPSAFAFLPQPSQLPPAASFSAAPDISSGTPPVAAELSPGPFATGATAFSPPPPATVVLPQVSVSSS